MSKNMYGFSMDLNFDKVWVGGEWVKVTSVSNSTAWSADLGYGNDAIAKRGSGDVNASYSVTILLWSPPDGKFHLMR